MNFKEELRNYQEYINGKLEEYVKEYIDKPNLYEKKLNDSIIYSLLAGGKRIRPVLILSTYKLFKDDIDICIPYFIAMEMVHNFSLIHDDLPAIDNDDFRHNIPTNHKKFGESTAILAGDALLNYAYIVLSKDIVDNVSNEKLKIFNEFSQAILNMITGEFVDIEWENKKISNEMLLYMHKNKTGALIKESVRIGAILGGANEQELKILTNYADNIGLAFQIKDDILSEIGDEKVMGKPAHNDKEANKSTFVTKYGLDKSFEMLNAITDESVSLLNETFKDRAWFLVEFAKYIRDREK